MELKAWNLNNEDNIFQFFFYVITFHFKFNFISKCAISRSHTNLLSVT